MKKKSSNKILNKRWLIYVNALFKWSTNVSKVDGKWSSLKLFLVNILCRNSFALEPGVFFIKITYWTEVTTDGLAKESGGNSPKSITSLSLSILFFNVRNVAIFPIYENS